MCYLTEIRNYFKSVIPLHAKYYYFSSYPHNVSSWLLTHSPTTFSFSPIQLKFSFAIRAFHLNNKYSYVTTILKLLYHLFIDYGIKSKL